MGPMADFKGIPIHGPAPAARSGEKYLTPQGFTAIKDGIKQSAASKPFVGGKKPPWLRAPLAAGKHFDSVKQIVREHRLSTVCEEAKCPNIGECWNAGTATIMLMGAVCTRACRFCAVDTGNPRGWLDAEEPHNVAKSVQLMRLKYVVLTSVDRETLADLRAAQVDVLTLGQYLRPTPNHLNVERFVTPQQFDDYREWALELGFLECVSGPLVRSSYRAEQALARNNAGFDNTKLAVKAAGA